MMNGTHSMVDTAQAEAVEVAVPKRGSDEAELDPLEDNNLHKKQRTTDIHSKQTLQTAQILHREGQKGLCHAISNQPQEQHVTTAAGAVVGRRRTTASPPIPFDQALPHNRVSLSPLPTRSHIVTNQAPFSSRPEVGSSALPGTDKKVTFFADVPKIKIPPRTPVVEETMTLHRVATPMTSTTKTNPPETRSQNEAAVPLDITSEGRVEPEDDAVAFLDATTNTLHPKPRYFVMPKLAIMLAFICIVSGLVVTVQGFFPLSLADLGKNPTPEEDFFGSFIHRQKSWLSARLLASTTVSPTERQLVQSSVTLRSFLENNATGFSLAMAPAFFGFYGYFGVLAAWDEQLSQGNFLRSGKIKSLAGASAGAMAAVLLAAGIPPRVAGEFCSSVTLDKFADFPGLGGLFRGILFEKIMDDFLRDNIDGGHTNSSLLLLQNAKYPVAVTGFCLQSMQGKVLNAGSMARAARASATFPLLFEPVGWKSLERGESYTLIDGGIGDPSGVAALKSLPVEVKGERVVNLKVGEFRGKKPPGPNEIPGCREMLSISILNLPRPGPHAMQKGSMALQAAHDAMVASLDLPLLVDKTGNHFELHIDASEYW